MERMRPALAAALLMAAVPLAAQQEAPPPAAPPAPTAFTQLGDAADRMTVPVRVAGAGPFDFIIDTGAERSVLSRELAAELGLPAGRQVNMTAMIGSGPVETVIVPTLAVSARDWVDLAARRIEAPVLARANLGAAGMLGIDALQGQSLTLDLARDTMQLTPTPPRRRVARRADEIVVRAKSLYGQLIVTDASWRGKRIRVIVDTGSPVTIANAALRRLARKPPASLGPVEFLAVNGERLFGDMAVLNDLQIGGVALGGAAVAFAEATPFARFGLTDTPALLLGMNTLRMFRQVTVDFTNREIRFSLPRPANAANVCGALNIRCSRFL
ncbi:aspartyl protease family protein [Sphingomonas aracearum]|uniref:Peptidase A2 domain-containing protein n=1 Tax=Sphingomonas aracearum TaxID=2283317 RepID=A0A369W597_9SPHN|nr:aspartyl protease family protein [Sphingomonas aracearum]RDE07251.1 hypothetical protein DVW87_06380 [Sphingomonas aracearum]